MKLTYKLILGYLLVASIASSAAYFAHRSYGNINAAFDRLIEDPVMTLKSLNDLKNSSNHIIALTNEIILVYAELDNPDQSKKNALLADADAQFIPSIKHFDDVLKGYEELVNAQSDVEKNSLQAIKKSSNALIDTCSQIVTMKKTGISGEEILRKKVEFAEREKVYTQAIDDARTFEYGQLITEQKIVHQTISDSTRTTLIVSFLTLTLAISLGLYISNSIARRITKLKKASEEVGDGKFETKINIEADDEIGALSRSFNEMVIDLNHSRAELISSKNFVNNIVSSIADGLFVLDMDMKIIRVNQAALSLTGYEEKELVNQPIKVLRRDTEFFNERETEELHTRHYVNGIETLWKTKEDREIPVLYSASIMQDSEGGESGIVCIAQDITVRKSLENQLTHQALHDPLTKLANRVLFRNRLEHALALVERTHDPIAVMFLDLDNFKTVNDTLGHEAGDILLISVAERLVACLRPSDTIARLGGDEFAILVENLGHSDEVALIAERLNDVLRASFLIDGKEVLVHTSIGIAANAAGNENAEDLLRNADVAMYKAKSQGKDQHVFFETQMHEDLIQRIEFETDLRHGIERREFVLHYQPIINLHTEQIIGMEALVRWLHPERGLIPPDKFIPVAEETGLIIPLGQWILTEACRQARAWQTEFDSKQNLSITVNLSNKQVQEEHLVRMVAATLAETELPAKNLILEITENTMLQNSEETIQKLNALKQLGVRLAIDDFGTGYSSLSYLQRFPIDVLKIDKSFIDKISHGREGAAVARAIITMSETLQLKTIAEGIETNGQNTTLQDLGCEFGQGYHFSRPLTKDAMNDFLRKSNLNDEHGWLRKQQQEEDVTSLVSS